MLLRQLQTITDETWDKCWPVSTLRPLALLDLISYLFFIKKTGEEGLMNDLLPALPPGIAYPNYADDLSWNRFKDLDPRSMHNNFTKENGVMDLMKYYANANLRYSDYFKAPLLITPSVVLLANAAELVKILEAADDNTQGLIIEHLISKSVITSQQGQVYIPENISKLMVSMLQPSLQDVVWDPSAGNASFLIHSAAYLRNKHSQNPQSFAGDIHTNLLTGMEGDLVQLRIAAMNMILHHISNPELKILDKVSQFNPLAPVPVIIFSNLFFTGIESSALSEERNPNIDAARKEVTLLQLILQTLQPGARVAVVVPDTILTGTLPEIIKLREEIILRSNLEAVISIGNNPLLYGGAIIIFNKNGATTNDVWFAELTNENGSVNNSDFDSVLSNNSLNIEADMGRSSILYLWNNKERLSATENCFYVPAGSVIKNNFNLGYTANRQLSNRQDFIVKTGIPVKQNIVEAEFQLEPADEVPLIKQEEIVAKNETLSVKQDPLIEPVFVDDALYAEDFSNAGKSRGWKKPLLYAFLILSVVGNIIFLIYYNNKPAINAQTPAVEKSSSAIINPPAINTLPDNNRVATKITTLKSSAIKNSGIAETSPSVTNKISADVPDIKKPAKEIATAVLKQSKVKETDPGSLNIPLEPNAGDARNNRYAVISKAFFYTRPNENSHIMGSITSYDNGELVSSTEKNGFVYAIFYNKDGNNISGWLSMKDLKLVE